MWSTRPRLQHWTTTYSSFKLPLSIAAAMCPRTLCWPVWPLWHICITCAYPKSPVQFEHPNQCNHYFERSQHYVGRSSFDSGVAASLHLLRIGSYTYWASANRGGTENRSWIPNRFWEYAQNCPEAVVLASLDSSHQETTCCCASVSRTCSSGRNCHGSTNFNESCNNRSCSPNSDDSGNNRNTWGSSEQYPPGQPSTSIITKTTTVPPPTKSYRIENSQYIALEVCNSVLNKSCCFNTGCKIADSITGWHKSSQLTN